MPYSKLHSLFQFYQPFCGSRDALSLFVEYLGDNTLRVHRQFYNHSEFSDFFLQERNDYEKMDYRDVTNDISFLEFNNLISQIIENPSFYGEFCYEMRNAVYDIFNLERNDDEFDNFIENSLKLINDAFCQYFYLLKEKRFVNDNATYSKALRLTETIKAYDENSIDDFSSKPIIDDIVDGELYELRVFNVGQANCSALIKYNDKSKTDYDVVMVYDLGFQSKHHVNKELNKMINKINSDTTILISHFDCDHINNISNHLQIVTNRWIFPAYSGRGVLASKVYQMLLRVAANKTFSNNLYIFPSPFSFSINIAISQHSGRNKDPYQSTKANSQCLVCKLSIGEKDVLIPADALYEEFDDSFILSNNKKYDYILVPHHGCKYIEKKYSKSTDKINSFIGDETIGIVMCGNNSYGHANINHLSWFNDIKMFDSANVYDDSKVKTTNPYLPIPNDYFPVTFK